MVRPVRVAFGTLGAFLRSRTGLVVENLALRHQLGILLRSKPAQLPLTSWDRALWVFVIHCSSGWRQNLVIVRPETVSTGTPAARPEVTTYPWWPDGGTAIPSDYVLTPKIRFSFTRTTECSRPQSLRSTS